MREPYSNVLILQTGAGAEEVLPCAAHAEAAGINMGVVAGRQTTAAAAIVSFSFCCLVDLGRE
jgi:hypothetical protein